MAMGIFRGRGRGGYDGGYPVEVCVGESAYVFVGHELDLLGGVSIVEGGEEVGFCLPAGSFSCESCEMLVMSSMCVLGRSKYRM